MALLDTQPDDLEPIEFTHFDCWFDDEDGEGGAAMRTGFAPTGAQLSVSLVAKAPLFVDECVEIAAGTLTFEAFYWPRR